MPKSGQIVTFRFPQTNLTQGKLRPALLIAKVPGSHDDWLTCMISSQVRHFFPALDELVVPTDLDFPNSGLSVNSVIRLARIAVVTERVFIGKLGEISDERNNRIRQRLIDWLRNA